MAKKFYLRDTNLANGVHVVTHEKEMDLTVQSGSGIARVSSGVAEGASALLFCFTTPSGEPNSADWPAASAGDPYEYSLDISAAGANMTYGFGTVAGQGHWAVVLSDLSAHRGAATGLDDHTGTGIKTFANTTANPGAGDASDRAELTIAGTNTNSMMSTETVTLDVDSADSWFRGPWDAGVAATSYMLPNRANAVIPRRR